MATANNGEMTILEIISHNEKEIARLQEFTKRLREAAQAGGMLEKSEMPQTAVQMAVVVLKEARGPLHTKEIATRIQAKYGRVMKPSSLGTQLYKAAEQRNVLFVKDPKRKNTYRLREAH